MLVLIAMISMYGSHMNGGSKTQIINGETKVVPMYSRMLAKVA